MKKIKILSIVILSAILVGCTALHDKVVRVVSYGAGGKTTLIEPKSGNTAPEVVIGTYTSSITTIPKGTKLKSKLITYELFSGHKLFEETLEVDSTFEPPKVTYKKK